LFEGLVKTQEGLTLATKPSSEAQDPVRWAVVGSRPFQLDWLVPAIVAARGAAMAALVSRNPARIGREAERLGVPNLTPTLPELVDLGVEAVHIATPNQLHVPMAIEAACLGLHVLVEKPMAMTVADCRSIVESAEAAGVLAAVGSCMAWAPPVEQAGRLVHTARIGTPLHAAVSAGFDSPPASLWRQELATGAGGGPLFDLGAHAVDALIRLLGPVASVMAVLDHARYRYPAEDIASLLLRFRSGAHGTAHLSFAAALNTLRVDGPDGSLTSTEWLGRRFRGNLALVSGNRGAAQFDEDRAVAGQPIPLEEVDVFVAQIEETSRAIRTGDQPRNGAAWGLAVAEVLEAAVISAADGRRVALEELA
jgi:1,5-anhydro-D-fructose reductase (1,5-anhydro-D-mannitol-forming)